MSVASPAIQGPNQSANITNTYGSAHLYINEPYAPIGQLDLYPLAGALAGSLIGTSGFTAYTDWNLDFNGAGRDQTFRGAYSGAGTNPGWRLALATKNSGADSDADGVQDLQDNCMQVSNPTQLDADGDGYGNACDGDLNNSGLVTATDFNLLRSCLNQLATASPLCATADMNGSGLVTATDFSLLRTRVNTAPGPSGLQP